LPAIDLLTHLRTRRSVSVPFLGEPGPSPAEIEDMLAIAVRVPDHGKIGPWRFIVYDKPAREAAARRLAALAEAAGDEAGLPKRLDAAARFAHPPLVIGVVSAPADHPKIPLWEQQLSAGAAALNLVHAAHAHGYAAQWLTDWYAYDEGAARYLGARHAERFAAFIHIGTATAPPTERERKRVEEVVTVWRAE